MKRLRARTDSVTLFWLAGRLRVGVPPCNAHVVRAADAGESE